MLKARKQAFVLISPTAIHMCSWCDQSCNKEHYIPCVLTLRIFHSCILGVPGLPSISPILHALARHDIILSQPMKIQYALCLHHIGVDSCLHIYEQCPFHSLDFWWIVDSVWWLTINLCLHIGHIKKQILVSKVLSKNWDAFHIT
jgi:hypothetical protein